jgi:ATP adenylyltransferase/5',5'''-P-1,P-4-tetraphosphate phosphorylase II
MKKETILQFDTTVARKKPNSVHRKSLCPFCERGGLSEILDTRDSIILVKNKYPVLDDSFQTVLIETDECESELSEYPKSHLYKVLRFGIEKWLKMEEDDDFESVLFFKNHGPLSGGSIRHPHMQIVGLNNVNYRDNLTEDYFIGHEIHSANGVQLNLSTKPMIGFTEFNIVLDDLDKIDQAADYIQKSVHYVIHHFNGRGCSSYNLFFYNWIGKIFIKVIPRYATTPLYVGYGLRQVFRNPHDLIDEMTKLYF